MQLKHYACEVCEKRQLEEYLDEWLSIEAASTVTITHNAKIPNAYRTKGFAIEPRLHHAEKRIDFCSLKCFRAWLTTLHTPIGSWGSEHRLSS